MSQPLLSASQILGAVDLGEDVVEVPEWGGHVRLVQLTAAESMQLTRDMDLQENVGNGMFLMLVYSARDEQNARLFTPDDIEKLKLKNFHVLNMLQNRALQLNAMRVPDKAALKKD